MMQRYLMWLLLVFTMGTVLWSNLPFVSVGKAARQKRDSSKVNMTTQRDTRGRVLESHNVTPCYF